MTDDDGMMAAGGPAVGPAARGITHEEALRRLEEGGPNLLPEPPEPTVAQRIAGELRNAFTVLLLAAAGVSIFVLREPVEGGAILAIVILNGAIAIIQEERASEAMRALKALTSPTARVYRSGELTVIDAAELVPGDVVELEAGDRLPADIVLDEAVSFAVDEANLTGESLPVEKDASARPGPDALLAERPNQAFASTVAVRGRARGTVAATGAATAVGSLASYLGERPEAPLEREVRDASGKIAIAAIVLGVVIAVEAVIRGGDDSVADGIFAGVALAVAAVPEGLLTVVTTALALGARRMAARGAIVRKLSAIEGLGATSVLCTDKTGTLTEGSLSVAGVATGDGFETAFWEAALLCNNAAGDTGDPIDVALAREARRLGYDTPEGKRIEERPFDAATRSMTTVHELEGRGRFVSVKGAPEAIFPRCKEGPEREKLEQRAAEMASQGLRVLALAGTPGSEADSANLDAFGVVGFRDPLRPSAVSAVQELQRAGIHVVMVTGDHMDTARAIARLAGIPDSPAVSGADLARLAPEERAELLANATVVARVEPGVKVDLVAAHRKAGHVVAMTGDGVNDAPALRAADVGVAVLGSGGTDVAREASSVVVTDSDLDTLAAAVREGRLIFRNLVNAVSYLLTGNISEIVVVIGALFLLPDLAVPLLPVQLLWINLVTDGLPAIALALDEARDDPMARPPRSPSEHLLSVQRQLLLGLRGSVVGLVVLVTGYVASERGWTDDEIRTQLVLSVLVTHLLLAYVVRARLFTFEPGWWRNRVLLAAVGGSLALQTVALLTPAGRSALGFEALPGEAWLLAAAAGVAVLVVNDIVRMVHGAAGRRDDPPARMDSAAA